MKYFKAFLFAIVLQVAAYAQINLSSEHFYVFVYFDNSNDVAGARLAFSSDAINWQKYNNGAPVIVPVVGSEHRMRDPNVVLDPKTGMFHMVWTTGWKGTTIGHAASKDLVNWGEQNLIPLGQKIRDVSSLWAPEMIYDDMQKKYMFYWSTECGNGYRTWYSMTSDFKNYSSPTQFFDPGYSVIDATILKVDSTRFFMFFKDERNADLPGMTIQTKNIHYVVGPSMQGPWSSPSKSITRTGVEGPTVIKIGDRYNVYVDPFLEPQGTDRVVSVGNVDTTGFPWAKGPLLKNIGGGNFFFSHGSIYEIPKVKLLAALNGVADPTVYPEAYVAFQDSAIHIAEPYYPPSIYPLGKRNTGCGTGVGLAFLPPLFFKVMSYRKKKKVQSGRKSEKV